MASRKSKSKAQLDREIREALRPPPSASRGALRDLIRRARAGAEPGAELVAGDAIMAAGYSPERAGRALSPSPISEEVRAAVRQVESKRIARRDAAVAGHAARKARLPPTGSVRKANDQIHDLIHNRYFASIPLDQLFAIVERAGLRFDPSEKESILTGRSGRDTWRLFNPAGAEVDHLLVLTWHKMDTTGRYEIVAYVS
jgi:hypothetical protein